MHGPAHHHFIAWASVPVAGPVYGVVLSLIVFAGSASRARREWPLDHHRNRNDVIGTGRVGEGDGLTIRHFVSRAQKARPVLIVPASAAALVAA